MGTLERKVPLSPVLSDSLLHIRNCGHYPVSNILSGEYAIIVTTNSNIVSVVAVKGFSCYQAPVILGTVYTCSERDSIPQSIHLSK